MPGDRLVAVCYQVDDEFIRINPTFSARTPPSLRAAAREDRAAVILRRPRR